MTRNPNFRGEKPAFDEVQWIKYGNNDAVERALTLGEIDLVPEVQQATFARLEEGAGRRGRQLDLAVVHAAHVQPLQQAELPGREVQPGGPGRQGPPGDRVRGRPQADQRDRVARHRVRGPRAAPRVLQGLLLRCRQEDYALDVDQARTRCSTRRAGSAPTTAACARRAAPSCPSTCSCARSRRANIQAARLVREMTAADRRRLQGPGRLRGQADGDHHPQGQGQDGARLRHVHLGLGRRSLRPGPAAQPDHHEGDRRLLGRVLLEPRVRPPLRPAVGRVRRGQAQGDRRPDDRPRAARPALPRADGRLRRCRPTARTSWSGPSASARSPTGTSRATRSATPQSPRWRRRWPARRAAAAATTAAAGS